jgi:hyperosmotically inducible periplasmic protein
MMIERAKMRGMKGFKAGLAALCAAIVLGFATIGVRADETNAPPPGNAQIAKEVRHKLLMLPYYGVFDNLAYSINGSTVTLYGQVVRASTRSDAARSVARIEGVTRVINKIEVLPLSSFDDRIRAQTFRSIANTAGLHRYLRGANPSIHIVVNRGHVTLTGVVSNKSDRQLAYMAANSVTSFSVTNDLQVEGDEAR